MSHFDKRILPLTLDQVAALAVKMLDIQESGQSDVVHLEHLRNTLQIIADFPITDQKNQDAHNMALMARQALRATNRKTV